MNTAKNPVPAEEPHRIPDPRILELEAALIRLFHKIDEISVVAPGEVRDHAKAAYREAEEIIQDVGLAHRVWDEVAS